MSNVVLTYFNIKARAESIKLALHLAHITYTNNYVGNWPVEKEEGMKNGILPFGHVPLLQIDDINIVQSGAILRYISRKYLSKDMEELTRVREDIMIDGWNDLLTVFYRYAVIDTDHLPEFLDGACVVELGKLNNLYIRYGVMIIESLECYNKHIIINKDSL